MLPMTNVFDKQNISIKVPSTFCDVLEIFEGHSICLVSNNAYNIIISNR